MKALRARIVGKPAMAISFEIGILPNRPFQECVDLCLAVEDFGFGGVWVADSQSVMRDAYALLSVVGARTSRIRLASGVTNALTRHLAVLACSWATLDELSGGRAVMGIGVGESSVRNIGLKPDRLADLEAKIGALRALMRGEEATWGGETFHLSWPKRAVPIFMACSGPRSLQMGGRVADGILFQVGAEPSFVRYALDNIRLGAEQAGRRMEDITLYMRLACAVSDDRDKAREQVKGYAAVAAGTTFQTVPRKFFPDRLWAELAEFRARYDYYQHGDNRAAHTELLTDRIIDGIAIAGTPDEAVPRFQELADMGIDGFVCPAGMEDAMDFIRLLAEKVVPRVG
jgi:5,10-methylenetetrahydromethanopterin reductase